MSKQARLLEEWKGEVTSSESLREIPRVLRSPTGKEWCRSSYHHLFRPVVKAQKFGRHLLVYK